MYALKFQPDVYGLLNSLPFLLNGLPGCYIVGNNVYICLLKMILVWKEYTGLTP